MFGTRFCECRCGRSDAMENVTRGASTSSCLSPWSIASSALVRLLTARHESSRFRRSSLSWAEKALRDLPSFFIAVVIIAANHAPRRRGSEAAALKCQNSKQRRSTPPDRSDRRRRLTGVPSTTPKPPDDESPSRYRVPSFKWPSAQAPARSDPGAGPLARFA
jgi:hypothetical protein